MFDAKQLIGALLQGGMTGSSHGRIEHALGEQGLGQPGGTLSQIGGGALGGTAGAGGMLGGLAEMAKSMLGDAGRSLQSGNPAAVGGLGALAGALLGGGGRSVKGALGGGAMALLGSLALNALRNRAGQLGMAGLSPSEIPVGLRGPSGAAEEQEVDATALLVLKSMISAAKADGAVDENELQRIVGKLQAAGADAQAQEFVRNELRQPLDLDALIRAVPNLQAGAQVYAAALLAIEVDTDAERAYLQRLAQGLGLEQSVVQNLHSTLGLA
jgi:uncharacterized membrane protein YebE (DUF533 family)